MPLAWLAAVAREGFSALFPSPCRSCGQPLRHARRIPVCTLCLTAVTPPDPLTSCHLCGKRTLEHQPCLACRIQPPAYDDALSWAEYAGTARRLIHLLKYEHVLPLGRYLAAQLDLLPLREADAVVPVPLGRRRRRERGYNQAEQIAWALARRRGLPCAPGWLVRRVETRSQAGLSQSERETNVRDAFRAPARNAIRGRRILLVDDVLTTGATARAAAAALKSAGAGSVHVVTVARADLDQQFAATWTGPEQDTNSVHPNPQTRLSADPALPTGGFPPRRPAEPGLHELRSRGGRRAVSRSRMVAQLFAGSPPANFDLDRGPYPWRSIPREEASS